MQKEDTLGKVFIITGIIAATIVSIFFGLKSLELIPETGKKLIHGPFDYEFVDYPDFTPQKQPSYFYAQINMDEWNNNLFTINDFKIDGNNVKSYIRNTTSGDQNNYEIAILLETTYGWFKIAEYHFLKNEIHVQKEGNKLIIKDKSTNNIIGEISIPLFTPSGLIKKTKK